MRQGDERALSTVYDRHSGTAYSLAISIVGNSADAEEVVADAFLRLWRADDYDVTRGSLGAYLTVVTRSRALDRVRARRRRGKAEEKGSATDSTGFALPVAAAAEEPGDAAIVSDERERLRTAIDSLSEKQRVVIDLAYYGGFTHREIAARLSEPLGTVKTRLRDGMKKLRQVMPGQGRTSS